MQPILLYIRKNGFLLSMIFGCHIECQSQRVLIIYGKHLTLNTSKLYPHSLRRRGEFRRHQVNLTFRSPKVLLLLLVFLVETATSSFLPPTGSSLGGPRPHPTPSPSHGSSIAFIAPLADAMKADSDRQVTLVGGPYWTKILNSTGSYDSFMGGSPAASIATPPPPPSSCRPRQHQPRPLPSAPF
jgi:hypothetical protein